jgi:uncharacterized secreted protein with C-terminal beta-propeller domain
MSALAASMVVVSCGGGGPAAEGPGPEPVGLLRKVDGAAELEASIKAGFAVIQPADPLDTTLAGVASGATSIGTYSRTYTQDLEVDEFDSVKYDGEFLFIAPMRRFFPCCFLADQALPASAPPAQSSIRILATDPATAGATEVSTIPLADDISVQGLYRSADRLIAMTSRSFYGSYGDAWASFAVWAPEESGIAIYDTTDIAEPTLLFEASFEGIFIESRRVDDIVYVVSRFTPWLDNLDYSVTTLADQVGNEALLDDVPLADLLPKITVNGETRALVAPENCYVPSEGAPAYPVITSITAIPVADPAAFTTTCYNDDAYGVYVSAEAVYVAQSQSEGQATRIHKFSLQGGVPAYAGSADVDGIVWTGGQADFRLNEKDGDLRVFASKIDSSAPDFVDHFLYVLRESATLPQLDVVSRLPNDERPEEIGKPNEQLFGVRFMDDRAYAVSFEQIDPLYVFDLSDSADPRILGRLEVRGFSNFLHPVSDILLLGLGRSDDNAIKLELFDISVPSQPLSLGSDILGGPGSFSEAEYDRHAFTYLADIEGVDRFAIPADLTAIDGTFDLVESGLYLYEIRDKALPNFASLHRVGGVIVLGDESGGVPAYSARSRAVLHEDAIYYVRDEKVFSALWHMPEDVTGPN